MNIAQVKEQTFNYHLSGFNCAESVCRAILEQSDYDLDPAWARAATAFGGGMGRSFQETCGALTGGLVALGFMFGRGPNRHRLGPRGGTGLGLSDRIYPSLWFFQLQNHPGLLRPQENDMKCIRLSEVAAGILAGIINERAESA